MTDAPGMEHDFGDRLDGVAGPSHRARGWSGPPAEDGIPSCLEPPDEIDAFNRALDANRPRTSSPWPLRATPARALRIRTVAELINAPPRSYLLHGLIAPRELSVWWGAPKCGKSFLLLRIAYALSLGQALWGRCAIRPLRVLYLAAEGESGLGLRLRALREALGDAGEQLAVVAQRIELGPPCSDLDTVIALAKRHRADLVIVDTLARTFGTGNEDSAQDMGAFVGAMDRLREEAGAHVAVVHHGPKGEDAKTPRGSGALLGAADLVVKVKKGSEGGTSVAVVEHAKDDADGAELPFRLRVVTLTGRHDEALRDTCIAEPAETEPAARKRRTLPEGKAGWLRDLEEAFAEPGLAQPRTPLDGMPVRLTLTREQIRTLTRVRVRLDADPHATLTPAQRRRLSDALIWLSDHGFIGMTEELVWLP